jgi:L-ascorbate metabolism protein UlaG (beta-lactamase superfamily)
VSAARPTLVLACLLLVACAALPLPKAVTYHPSDADLTVTRIVHASLIVEMRGTRVLVDPWFHSGGLVRQDEPLGLLPEGLPPVAAVLITHGHADHLDPDALRALAPKVPVVIAPAALHAALAGLGFTTVTDLGWWDRTSVGSVDVTAVPARHGGVENGYVLGHAGVTIYVAGDTRTMPAFVDIATVFPQLDVAVLPVGGQRILGFLREMSPEEAARAAKTLGVRRIIPYHYGAAGGPPFSWRAAHPIQRFIDACSAEDIPADHVVVLEPGESWHYFK